jgi:ABC-type branched-subunit amino acid transport system ATPase component
MSPRLSVAGLTAGYGDLAVLRDLSFDVAEGEILCITGRNGVGKTTLMRAVSGAIPLLAGHITLNGKDITALATNKRQKLGLSYGPQENVSFAPLTVRENLTLHLDGHDLSRYERLFRAFPRIEERLEQKAGSLSGGERKILSFCRVMAEGGSLVALDEPTEGVAPENIALMVDAIRAAAAEGTALAIVEQNLTLVEAVADKVIVIDHGEIIYRSATMPNLRQEIEAQLRV